MTSFHLAWLDLAVIVGYFILILWVGLKMGRKEENLGDFALGERSVPWWAVLGSIIAAETSAGTFIGTPGEGYALRNYAFVQIVIGMILGRIIIAFLFIKPYYETGVYSIYEYLELRFGPRTKNAASATFLATRLLASGTRLYISAVILAVGARLLFPGLKPGGSSELLIYIAATALLTLMTAVYTTLGGIKAVVWTDLIQAALMIGSALGSILFILYKIPGGWDGVSAQLDGFSDMAFVTTGIDSSKGFWQNLRGILEQPYTIFAGVIASTFTTLGTHGTDQDMVQRMLTAKDFKRSRLSLILSGIMDLPIVAIFVTIGILLWAFYQAHPDPLLPKKSSEIFCYFILKEMPAGMRGLLIAGIFATTMGSLSAALNALATSFVRDWYEPYIAKRRDTGGSLRAARWATAGFAVLMISVAATTSYMVILFPESRLIPIALGILGYTYGSLLGVFLLGVLFRARGSDRGNLVAMAAGFLAVAVLSGLPRDVARAFGGDLAMPDWLPVIAFPWRILAGTVVTFGVGGLFRRESAPCKSPEAQASLLDLAASQGG